VKRLPLVRASIVRPFVSLLDELGANVAALLARARLSPAALARPETLVPLHQVCEFFEEAARREGIEDLGIRAGERLSIVGLGVYGRVIAQSLTLHEALQTAVRLHAHFDSSGCAWLAADEDRVWVRFRLDRRVARGWLEAEQLTLTVILHVVGLVERDATCPVEVELRASETPGVCEHEIFRNARVRFGRSTTAVAVPRSLLSRTVVPLAETRTARRDLEQRLVATGPAPDFAGSLRQVIATQLPRGYPDIGQSARSIGMSVRTLQRRLAESHTSYSRLVEQERFQTALQLLADADAKVTDIALELGYADLANFSHAFHRWTGVSPSRYRRTQELPPPARGSGLVFEQSVG
jgi:AraC-like DNA-binding protein